MIFFFCPILRGSEQPAECRGEWLALPAIQTQSFYARVGICINTFYDRFCPYPLWMISTNHANIRRYVIHAVVETSWTEK
jgi:hypothetical protein